MITHLRSNGAEFDFLVYMYNTCNLLLLSLSVSLIFCACSSPGSKLFGKKTPHQQYEKKIEDAGLHETALGDAWFKAAASTLTNPLNVSLPYTETGYFAADRASAVGLRFKAHRGEKLTITLLKKPAENFEMYVDLWQSPTEAGGTPKLLLSADTVNFILQYVVTGDTVFIVRIQPELLKDGAYTLTITTGPSLSFPISPKVKSSIGSFFGAGRDKGERRHEGIDIFAPVHSPAVASATGTVTRVNENPLGGKVVFMTPDNSSYTLYYAHLDSQIAVEGQVVKTGDVLGLTGNTGNAKYTPSHLHFGIYTNSGAIDPLYFVKPPGKQPPGLSVPLRNLGTWMRTVKNARLYMSQGIVNNSYSLPGINTLIRPEAGTGNYYRVILPDGTRGFISGNEITPVTKPLKKLTVKKSQVMFSTPDLAGLHKKVLPAGDKINVLAYFKDFYFISDMYNEQGWLAKNDF